jgi:hypothetical protein
LKKFVRVDARRESVTCNIRRCDTNISLMTLLIVYCMRKLF